MSTKTYPAAAKVPRAVMQTVTDLEDPEQVLQIPRQDLGNIPRMQKGLHSKGIRQTWLAVEQEKIILNMHQELDRYLKIGRAQSELQSLMRISYAVLCLKQKKHKQNN